MHAESTDAGQSMLASPARLAALRATGLLDSDVEESFDRLTRLAVRHVGVPAAFISLVDEHRDFYKSACGFGEPLAAARELQGPTFCHYTIRSAVPLVIPDTAADPRYRDVPTVKSLGVAAYVGIPIVVGDQSIGAFCAIDTSPRQWTDDEIHLLTELATSAQREIAIRASEREARETASRLTVAMEAAQLGAWTHDIGSRTRWHAAQANRIMGRSAVDGAVLVEDWLAQVHPEDRGVVQAAFEGAAAGQGLYMMEYRLQWEDGSEHWACAAGTLLQDATGAPTKLVGTLEDITARKHAEALTRASEGRLRSFIEAVPLLAWLNHADGTAAFFNRRWYEYTGQDDCVTSAGRWMEAIHPDDIHAIRALRNASVAASAPYEVELRLRRADGTFRWHVARVAPSLGEDGTVLSWAGGALDVDDRRRLETELRASEARFRLVQDASPDGSVLLQPTGDAHGVITDFTITYANASAARILFVESPDRIAGRTIRDVFPESVLSIPSYAHVLETGEPLLTETYFTRDGVRRGLRLTAVRVDRSVHVAFADLTDRLSAEAERERLLVAEREAHAAANAARREAEEANAVKAQFLATMSHELRTPLNAIGGYAQLIELGVHGPVSPAQSEALARIQHSQKHLLGLITGVLNYAKLEAGAVTYHAVDVPALEIARGWALVAPQARTKEIALAVEGSSAELLVRADPEKARQVVLNLLSNAVKFTAPGGRVHVRCAPAPRARDAAPMVEFRVEDTGRGIHPGQLAQVFDPFVQVGRELTSEQAGTGLGLAISRDLARGMGGDIVATSTVGVGSLFVLTLPHA